MATTTPLQPTDWRKVVILVIIVIALIAGGVAFRTTCIRGFGDCDGDNSRVDQRQQQNADRVSTAEATRDGTQQEVGEQQTIQAMDNVTDTKVAGIESTTAANNVTLTALAGGATPIPSQ